MEEGPTSQRMWTEWISQPLESGRGKETNSPLRPLEGSLPRDHGIGVETWMTRRSELRNIWEKSLQVEVVEQRTSNGGELMTPETKSRSVHRLASGSVVHGPVASASLGKWLHLQMPWSHPSPAKSFLWVDSRTLLLVNLSCLQQSYLQKSWTCSTKHSVFFNHLRARCWPDVLSPFNVCFI